MEKLFNSFLLMKMTIDAVVRFAVDTWYEVQKYFK